MSRKDKTFRGKNRILKVVPINLAKMMQVRPWEAFIRNH